VQQRRVPDGVKQRYAAKASSECKFSASFSTSIRRDLLFLSNLQCGLEPKNNGALVSSKNNDHQRTAAAAMIEYFQELSCEF
jgi:hypothetical protein